MTIALAGRLAELGHVFELNDADLDRLADAEPDRVVEVIVARLAVCGGCDKPMVTAEARGVKTRADVLRSSGLVDLTSTGLPPFQVPGRDACPYCCDP